LDHCWQAFDAYIPIAAREVHLGDAHQSIGFALDIIQPAEGPNGCLKVLQCPSRPSGWQDVASATMQEDGNLVLYSSGGDPVWASQTDGNAGSVLVLQDDRNLVIYASDGGPVWATDTSG
jgi:hypothetical protein